MTLLGMITRGILKARRPAPSQPWTIARSELLRATRLLYGDRSYRLARVLEAGPVGGRLGVVTDDRQARKILAPWEPVYASSLFDLATLIVTTPLWGVLIDCETVGTAWATDAALQIGSAPDRPFLYAIAPQDVAILSKPWSAVIERPLRTKSFTEVLT